MSKITVAIFEDVDDELTESIESLAQFAPYTGDIALFTANVTFGKYKLVLVNEK